MKTINKSTEFRKNTQQPAKRLLTSALILALISTASCGGGGGSSSGGSVADISGSGFVQGSIDGFGSVIVNGVHYNTDNAEFTVRSVRGQQADLKVGQFVTIIGSRTGSEGIAKSVSYKASLEGPVARIDADAQHIEILGQVVIVDQLTAFKGLTFSTLAVGDFIEVSGVRTADGAIAAGYIELETDGGGVELHGEISQLNLSDSTFMIQSQRVNYSAAQLEMDGRDIANGMQVEVEGTLNAGVLMATEVENEDLDIDEGTEVDIEGRITLLNKTDKLFEVKGISVRYSNDTEFDDGDMEDLANNQQVEVEGVVDAEGVLHAESIEFEESNAAELSASVEQVDSAAGTITVLGMTIEVNSSTRIDDDRDDLQLFSLADIVVGDYLELVVSRDQQGLLKALKLSRDENDSEVSLKADVSAINRVAKSVELLGKSYSLNANGISFFVDDSDNPSVSIDEFFAALQAGSTLELSGSVIADSLVISEAVVSSQD